MDSIITLADARVSMARFGIASAEFLRKINRVSEYLLDSDVYTDIFSIVEFNTSPGYITIPRCFGRAIGVQDDGLNKPIVNQQLAWIEHGIGRQDPNNMTLDGLRDLGSHFCTWFDVRDSAGVEQSGTLRVKLESATDAAKTIRFNGTFIDTDGYEKQVLDAAGNIGLNLTTVSPSADTTQFFKRVEGIQAPATMVGRWSLWKVISGVETLLGIYEPGETRPRYVRYETRVTDQPICVFCYRKYVPLVAETDWVFPSNMNATEYGFQALGYRDRGDFKTEEETWQQAKKVLKEQYARLSVGARTYFTSDDFGGLPHGRGTWGK